MKMLKAAVAIFGRFAKYRIVGRTYLDGRICEPYDGGFEFRGYNQGSPRGTRKPTYLRWRGLPNEAMRPANWAARIIWPMYKRSLGKPKPIEPAIRLEMAIRDGVIREPASPTPSLVFERQPLRLKYPKMQEELGADGDHRTANL